MKFLTCAQGSAEWFQARAGKVTGSEVCNALSFLKRGDKKGSESQARADYKAQIAAEIMSGEPILGGYLSKEMEHGTESEPFARAAYEVKFDVSVDQLGFVIHPTIERAGSSPDGLVNTDGMVEIKCPKTATHIDYMLNGGLPAEYEPQVMFGLACTEREWCDFISFDDRLPSRHKLFVKRVFRDDKRISEINAGVNQFLAEVDELIASLEKLNPELTQAQRVFGKDCMENPELGITDADIAGWWKSHGVTQ